MPEKGRLGVAWNIGAKADAGSFAARAVRMVQFVSTLGLIFSVLAMWVACATYQGRLERDWSRLPSRDVSQVNGYWDWDFDVADRRWVDIVFLAPTSEDFPLPPGLETLPQVGEVVMSPGLRESAAGREIAERYGEMSSDHIRPEGLTSADERVAYVVVEPDDLTDEAVPVGASWGIGVPTIASQGQLGGALRQVGIVNVVAAIGTLLLLPAAASFVIALRLRGPARDARALRLTLGGAQRRDLIAMVLGETWAPLLLGGGVAAVLAAVVMVVDVRLPWVDYELRALDMRAHPDWLAIAGAVAVGAISLLLALFALSSRRGPSTAPRIEARPARPIGVLWLPLTCVAVAWGIPSIAAGGYVSTVLLTMVAVIPVALTIPAFLRGAIHVAGRGLVRFGLATSSLGLLTGGRQILGRPAGLRWGASGLALIVTTAGLVQIWGTVLTDQQREAQDYMDRWGTSVAVLDADLESIDAAELRRDIGEDAEIFAMGYLVDDPDQDTVVVSGDCESLTALSLPCGVPGEPGPETIPTDPRTAELFSSLGAGTVIPEQRDPLSFPDSAGEDGYAVMLVSSDGTDLPLTEIRTSLAHGIFPSPGVTVIGESWLVAAHDQAENLRWGILFFGAATSLLSVGVAGILLLDSARQGASLAVLAPWGMRRRTVLANLVTRVLVPLVIATGVGTAAALVVGRPAWTPPLEGYVPETFIAVCLGLPVGVAGIIVVAAWGVMMSECRRWVPGRGDLD